MLGRSEYSEKEIERGKALIRTQVQQHRKLAKAAAAAGDDGAKTALAKFDRVFFQGLLLELDRIYVHRLRSKSGKDGNPLNEVWLIAESLVNNDGIFRTDKTIRYKPDQSVIGCSEGDRIEIDEDRFGRLSKAFFEDLERKFT